MEHPKCIIHTHNMHTAHNIDSLLVMDGSKSSLNQAFISPVALWECAIVCVHV